MTEERLVSPRKIAVLHAKALGDFMMTLPALTAIKQTYPQSHLILLTNPWLKEFLTGRPSPVDKLISIPPLPGVNDEGKSKVRLPSNTEKVLVSPEFEHFYDMMQAEKFDAILQMQGGGTHANTFVIRLGAKLTAGTCSSSEDLLDRSIPYLHYRSDVLRNLEIAGLIGVSSTDFEPHIETTVKDNREAADVIESFGGKPYIVLHPGAEDIRLRWPPVKFAAVADSFSERGYQVIMTGLPKEKPLITEIIQYMQRAALAQTSLSIGGLAALLAHASVVISNDTGPLHLARAVGTRTVGIFWMPNLINRGPTTSKGHRVAVSWSLECPTCRTKPVSPWPFLPVTDSCNHPHSFVESVSISEVIGLAHELLNGS